MYNDSSLQYMRGCCCLQMNQNDYMLILPQLPINGPPFSGIFLMNSLAQIPRKSWIWFRKIRIDTWCIDWMRQRNHPEWTDYLKTACHNSSCHTIHWVTERRKGQQRKM